MSGYRVNNQQDGSKVDDRELDDRTTSMHYKFYFLEMS